MINHLTNIKLLEISFINKLIQCIPGYDIVRTEAMYIIHLIMTLSV